MRFLLISFILLLSADIAFACSCGQKPSVLEAYEKSHGVFVARLVAVKKTNEQDKKDEEWSGFGPAMFVIERVYKGSVRVNDEVTLEGGDCLWTFNQAVAGHQFLLYAMKPDELDEWFAPSCGRTKALEFASEDLLYLDNEPKLRGKTRISGTYSGWLDNNLDDVAGKNVRIVGESKTYELKTDAQGVFEIYDLPPGKYVIEPEKPKGWKLSRRWLSFVASLPDEQILTDSVSLKLEPKKHTSIELGFEPDSAILGKVVGPQGAPMADVCLKLTGIEGSEAFLQTTCTDPQGRYRLEAVFAGTYILVINPDGKITPRDPFARLFYPNVAEHEKATRINITAGEVVKDVNLVIPKLAETITVTGVLRYSDGKPVSGESVNFSAVNTEGIDGNDYGSSNEQGRFTLTLLKGVPGDIYGSFAADVGEYQNCPKLDALIKDTGGESAEIKSSVIRIDGQHDVFNLVLKFPFPLCFRK